jgi:hypothetical protein
VAVPDAHVTETVTDAPISGTQSLLTWNVSVLRLLTIVQAPTLKSAAQVPLEVYPPGTGDSVAVQSGSPVKPVTVKTAGLDSEAGADTGVSDPLAHERLTVTPAALLGTKSLLTWKVSLVWLLTIVQVPTLSRAEQVAVDVYPLGTGDSVAVQFGSPTKPVTVNIAGVDSDALAEAGVADPLAQERLTVTLAALFGTKSLATWKVSLVCVLTMVHVPMLSRAAQVPLEV